MAVVEILKTTKDSTPSILQTKCKAVSDVNDPQIQTLIQNILDTAHAATDPEAAGLAAPQIGVNKRVCLVREFKFIGEEEKIIDHILVNPKVLSTSAATDIKFEACLSIPNLYGQVERHKRITIVALNEKGKEIKIKADGFFARVIQHELDHLDGILYTAKVIGKPMTEKEYEEWLVQKTQK